MSYRKRSDPKKWLVVRRKGKSPIRVVAGERFRTKKKAEKEAREMNKAYKGSDVKFMVRPKNWRRKMARASNSDSDRACGISIKAIGEGLTLSKNSEGFLEKVSWQAVNKNDALAQLLGYKSSNNGAYWTELAALKAYGLVEGRNDLRITELAKQVTYGTEDQKPQAILRAFMNIPLWKQLYERYRLQLPSQEFWAKLQHITGCEAPVAKSNEQFITETFKEDTDLIKSSNKILLMEQI